jgi:DNA repair protein RadC
MNDMPLPSFQALKRAKQEYFAAVHFADGYGILGRTISTSGASQFVTLPYRDIVRDALNLGSGAILLAHNHPSGDPTPSRNDIRLTHRLVDILAPLSIRLEDHIIVAGPRMVSMKALNLL